MCLEETLSYSAHTHDDVFSGTGVWGDHVLVGLFVVLVRMCCLWGCDVCESMMFVRA